MKMSYDQVGLKIFDGECVLVHTLALWNEREEKYREELAAKETREMEAVQAKEAEIRAERDGEILSRAATTIQSLWKGFKARSSTARKASGKKGKGKKK